MFIVLYNCSGSSFENYSFKSLKDLVFMNVSLVFLILSVLVSGK